MKKVFTVLLACVMLLFALLPVYAANGKVTYSGNSGNFVFEPGGDHSPSDLFPNFKDVMPGDTLMQRINVKNDADNKVKVKIYIRALGAHTDSDEFLSKLGLKVKKSEDNEMAYMFDAAANESAQLSDWVCLGTLYSGGEVNLDVILKVPVELGNEFQSQAGYLDWEFMVEELPIEDSDPDAPQTGDKYIGLYIAVIICSLALIVVLLVWRKKDKENGEISEEL